MAKTVRYNEFKTLKRAMYPVRVASVDDDVSTYNGEEKDQYKFIFEVTAGQDAGEQIFDWCGVSLTPRSKLFGWLNALAPGTKLGPGFELDPEELVGREATALVGTKTRQDGQPGRNYIESLVPIEEEPAEAPAVPVASGLAPKKPF